MSNWNNSGQYGQQNPYGAPGHYGYGPSPGGMGPPPGMNHAQAPGGFGPPPSQPPNMPNINFSAPVIRMGTDGPGRTSMGGAPPRSRDANAEPLGNNRRAGLGFDGRDGERRRREPSPPPGFEECIRTLYIGNITERFGSFEDLEAILNSAQGLRRFKRPYDVKGKPCNYGFAEFRDADSLEAASLTLPHAKLPSTVQTNGHSVPEVKPDDVKTEDAVENADVKAEDSDNNPATDIKAEDKDETASKDEQAKESDDAPQLKVVSDEKAEEYVDSWRQRGSMRDPASTQFRLDSAREELAQILGRISRGGGTTNFSAPVDVQVGHFDNAEIVNIPDRPEDTFGLVPAEAQQQVQEEISAFRNRSTIREKERFAKEKKLEEDERSRAFELRVNASIKAEPLPTGPRERGGRGGPAGNRGNRGGQASIDHRDGVRFTGSKHLPLMTHEDEESDADDEEIEKRRNKNHQDRLEADFLRQERIWVDREKRTGRSVQRSQRADLEDASQKEQRRRENFEKFTSLRGDEAQKRRDWRHHFHSRRERERIADDKDREEEEREKQAMEQRRQRDIGAADQFLEQHASEVERIQHDGPTGQPQMSMSLGFALQKAQERKQQQIRAVAGVEHLLDQGEEEEAPLQLRRLEEADPSTLMEPQDTKAAVEQLVGEIPDETEEVFKFEVDWTYLDGDVLNTKLRPFVAKEIRAAVGNEEEMLVDAIIQGISKHDKAEDIVAEIYDALDEQAENIVRKTWRHLIFYIEAEKRGISY